MRENEKWRCRPNLALALLRLGPLGYVGRARISGEPTTSLLQRSKWPSRSITLLTCSRARGQLSCQGGRPRCRRVWAQPSAAAANQGQVRSEKLLSHEPEHPPAGLSGTPHSTLTRPRRHPDLLMRICNQHTHFAAVRASAMGHMTDIFGVAAIIEAISAHGPCPTLPVGCAKIAFEDLADRAARQIGNEIHRLRRLH